MLQCQLHRKDGEIHLQAMEIVVRFTFKCTLFIHANAFTWILKGIDGVAWRKRQYDAIEHMTSGQMKLFFIRATFRNAPNFLRYIYKRTYIENIRMSRDAVNRFVCAHTTTVNCVIWRRKQTRSLSRSSRTSWLLNRNAYWRKLHKSIWNIDILCKRSV